MSERVAQSDRKTAYNQEAEPRNHDGTDGAAVQLPHEHIVRQIYTHLRMAGMQGDLAPILQPLSDDVEWQSPGPEAIPWAGTVRGRKQAVRWFASRGKAIEIEQFVPKEFITQGNQVIVMCEERSRVKATGKSYDIAVMVAWTLLNGVVTHYREAYDTATVLAALQND